MSRYEEHIQPSRQPSREDKLCEQGERCMRVHSAEFEEVDKDCKSYKRLNDALNSAWRFFSDKDTQWDALSKLVEDLENQREPVTRLWTNYRFLDVIMHDGSFGRFPPFDLFKRMMALGNRHIRPKQVDNMFQFFYCKNCASWCLLGELLELFKEHGCCFGFCRKALPLIKKYGDAADYALGESYGLVWYAGDDYDA